MFAVMFVAEPSTVLVPVPVTNPVLETEAIVGADDRHTTAEVMSAVDPSEK
jgi:hypothetical protein